MRLLLIYANTYRDNPPPARTLHEALESFRPEAVGFSIRNLDNHNWFAPDRPLPAIKDCVRAARASGAITILGGGGVLDAAGGDASVHGSRLRSCR